MVAPVTANDPSVPPLAIPARLFSTSHRGQASAEPDDTDGPVWQIRLYGAAALGTISLCRLGFRKIRLPAFRRIRTVWVAFGDEGAGQGVAV
jgi:hypothetical protein